MLPTGAQNRLATAAGVAPVEANEGPGLDEIAAQTVPESEDVGTSLSTLLSCP